MSPGASTPAVGSAGPEAIPDALAPPPHHRRFPLLDGMRALAVLSIVVVHTPGYVGPAGSITARLLLHLNIGVTIFFLISGFLLYRPLVAHRAGGAPAPRLTDYAKRRILRIFPAYWLVLTVVVLLPNITPTDDGQWLSHYALLFTLSESRGWACGECGLSQTWSLVVELTFYACLPLYAIVAAKLARGRKTRGWLRLELLLLGALALCSVALHFVVYDGFPPALVGGSLLSFGLWFALGMMLALASVALEGRASQPAAIEAIRNHPSAIWALAISIYIAVSFALPATPFLTNTNQQLGAFVGFAIIATLLMLPAVFASKAGAPQAVLSNRLMSWLGLISYGIFLWHIAVIFEIRSIDDGLPFLLMLAATLSITAAIAAASYYLLERPILRYKYSRADRADAEPSAATILPRP